MLIKTSDFKTISPLFDQLRTAQADSHKGQNGRVLIIGGSSLFHSASIWAAEIASHFSDIVHYSSTEENNKIFFSLKKKMRNGIVVSRNDLLSYVKEDDAILVGPGMLRKFKVQSSKLKNLSFEDILEIKDEAEYTYYLVKFLIENFPDKKFVFDAGALQMMEKNWLLKLKTPAIITPHQREFEQLFGIKVTNLSLKNKQKIIIEMAKKYNVTILFKSIVDIVSDGLQLITIEGGNQGLTKGGTGDLLAGLTVSFYCKNKPLISASISSYLLKKSAELLYPQHGYWYNISNLIKIVPRTLVNSLKFRKLS